MDIFEHGRTARLRLAVLIDHLRVIRVPLLVVGLGALATLMVDQIAELFWLSLLPGEGLRWYLAMLIVGTTLGAAVWYIARTAFRLRIPRWPHLSVVEARKFRIWLPRMLGGSVPLLLAIGCLIAWAAVENAGAAITLSSLALRAGVLVLAAVLLMVLFVRRIPAVNLLRRRFGREPLQASGDVLQVDNIRQLGLLPILLFALTMAINLAVTVIVALDPGALDFIGPAAVVLLAGLFFCVTGGFASLVADRLGFPLLSALAAVVVVWHLLGINDNHLVRQHAEMSTYTRSPAPTMQRASFADYQAAWMKVHCATQAPCVVLLVAAEGGGVRAAAWTHLVLAELERRSGGAFARRWFAASGVSGGSLGLASFAASTTTMPRVIADDAITDYYATDFLSPTLANMFFVDLSTQRLLPLAWFNDRGRALSRAWEHAAHRHFGSDTLAAAFAGLYRKDDGSLDIGVPILLLNSTDVASGARVIQHGFDALPNLAAGAWAGAIDGAAWLSASMPLSEAALNSARFSYVSPAGTVRSDAGRLQLVDGGYFENSGATTLLDLIQAMRRDSSRELQFRVIHISNDVAVAPFAKRSGDSAGVDDQCKLTPTQQATSRGDATAPIAALVATRSARGDYARRMLQRSLAAEDRLWHFRLCDSERPLPLGWTLSRAGVLDMRAQLRRLLSDDAVAAIAAAGNGATGP